MPQVKFLKGRSDNLANIPLDNGAIYFTTDEQKLYIDTHVNRLPVIGNTFRFFYLRANTADWQTGDGNPTMTIRNYYDSKNDDTSYPISDILSSESVLFVGDKYDTNGNTLNPNNVVMCKGLNFESEYIEKQYESSQISRGEGSNFASGLKTFTFYDNIDEKIVSLFSDSTDNTKVNGQLTNGYINYIGNTSGAYPSINIDNLSNGDYKIYYFGGYNSNNSITKAILGNIELTSYSFKQIATCPDYNSPLSYYCFNLTLSEPIENQTLTFKNTSGYLPDLFSVVIVKIPDKDTPQGIDFELYQIVDSEGGNVIPNETQSSITSEIITDKLKDIWIQVFTPNPKALKAVPAACQRSVCDITETIYANAEYWNDNNEYQIIIDDINLTNVPFFVSLDDDSLENLSEFEKISLTKVDYDSSTNRSIITFTASENINFNINIDIVIVIADGDSDKSNILDDNTDENYWTTLTIPAGETRSSITLFKSGSELADIKNENELRELLVFCSSPNDTYNSIIDVSYDNGNYKITFNSEIKTEKTTITIVQLNNISDIYTAEVKLDDWIEVKNKDNETEYYYYKWPDVTSGVRLREKHQPLVYAAGSEYLDEFNKITETKVFQGKLIIYTKEKPESNLVLKIVDFI